MRISDWSSDVCSSDLASLLATQDDLEDGAIVNILDQKLANLNPDFFSYTLTQEALEAATTLLAQSLAPRVRAIAVSPGMTLPNRDPTSAAIATVALQNLLPLPHYTEDSGRERRI